VAGGDERVDQLEDGALIGGRQLLDVAEPLEQPRGPGAGRLGHGLGPEKLSTLTRSAWASPLSMAAGG
jgi:hypothetical protein